MNETKRMSMALTSKLSYQMAETCKPFCQGQNAVTVVASAMDFAVALCQSFGLGEDEMMEAFQLCVQARRRAGTTFKGEGIA